MGGFIDRVLVNPRAEVDRSRFPFTLPVFKDFDSLKLDPKVTFFVGENGSGKSTLMETMALQLDLPAEGGSKWHRYSTFDSHVDLENQIILARNGYPSEEVFFRSESFYNLASYLDQAAKGAGGVPRFGWTHERSHGQGFLDAFLSLKADGFYLFDEPESALSIRGQMTFLVQMQKLINEDCQLVIATHSPVILGFPGALIYQFSDEGIRPVLYEETDPCTITLRALRDPRAFHRLLGIG